jgi:hypothetical protein
MNGKKVTLLLGVLFLVFVLAAISPNAPVLPSRAEEDPDLRSKIIRLNTKARLARNGDETAVRELTDEVFNQFGTPITATLAASYKDRLVAAEIAFRKQGKKGVSERELAAALNDAGEELGLPDYAEVSVSQIRYLRVKLISAIPGIVGQTTEPQRGKSALHTEMSPVEAIAMTHLIVIQKLWNPDFQMTRAEWAKHMREQQLAKNPNQGREGTGFSQDAKLIVAGKNAKSEAIKQAALNHASDFAPAIDRYLARLGITE